MKGNKNLKFLNQKIFLKLWQRSVFQIRFTLMLVDLPWMNFETAAVSRSEKAADPRKVSAQGFRLAPNPPHCWTRRNVSDNKSSLGPSDRKRNKSGRIPCNQSSGCDQHLDKITQPWNDFFAIDDFSCVWTRNLYFLKFEAIFNI